jgi:hypothetical protein
MEALSLRSLERICRTQAALTTHEATKCELERWQRNIGLADSQDRQQDKEPLWPPREMA